MAQYRVLITYVIIYFFAISAAIRGLIHFQGRTYQWLVISLLAAFFLLLVIEPWLSRRSWWYTHFYLAVQTAITAALLLIPSGSIVTDYFAVLFIPLTLQAMRVFPPRIGFRWIIFFMAIMVILMLYRFGWSEGVPFILTYTVAYLFAGSYVAFMRQADTAREEAEAARQESQALFTELQGAHRQLQAYTAQAEELAAAKERNHLARELHDSVTQTIFSITLTAKSARMLLARDPGQVAAQLDHLQELAQSALAEMRALIFELRPPTVEEEGLISALRKHVAALKSQAGLEVDLQIEGERRLPGIQERRLFRIIQEALNNVVKYAQTGSAVVTLIMDDKRVLLEIEDKGIGFDPTALKTDQTKMGLASMRERAEMMGGTFQVDSHPGGGTRIRVEIPQATGEESDG
ncbi:MAG: sensor histidine kinase [Anaerolineae bacterium]|nr:sensor histidine kinase [Anaerolineae bacterium]